MKHQRQLPLLFVLAITACAGSLAHRASNASQEAEANNRWNAFLVPDRDLYIEYELHKGDTDGHRDWFGMDVRPSTDNQVSVRITGEVDTTPIDIAMPLRTGTLLMPLVRPLRKSPASKPIATTLLSPWWFIHFNNIKLDIGKEVISADCGGYHKIEVIAPCSYAGVEGVSLRWSDQIRTKAELCVNPGLPVPLMVRLYGDNGEPEHEVRAVEK